MGIKSFWALILLLALVAAVLNGHRNATAQPRSFRPGNSAGEVLFEPAETVAPAPKVNPPLPVAALPPTHVAKLQPKAPIAQPTQGGVVEREDQPRLVRMKDGSLIVDNYWTILSGDGTAGNPYRLTWDLLLSGQSEFDSAAPQPQLPARLKWLDGKHVVIQGYTLKSVTNGSLDEFLLNDQLMDNCPICTARSVFATVSVKAKAPEVLERGVINVFTVRGQFKAEPAIAAGFLLGVYFLRDAEIISRSH